MRLLNIHTLQVEMFAGPLPGYAILSHTWDAEEIKFEDMRLLEGKEAFLAAMNRGAKPRQSHEKILHSAEVARTRDFDYIINTLFSTFHVYHNRVPERIQHLSQISGFSFSYTTSTDSL
jgi:hypothetical protein